MKYFCTSGRQPCFENPHILRPIEKSVSDGTKECPDCGFMLLKGESRYSIGRKTKKQSGLNKDRINLRYY